MGTHCDPAAIRGTIRPRAPWSARGTTRKTLPIPATPSLGCKLLPPGIPLRPSVAAASTRRAECEPAAIRGTVRPRRPRPATGTTRKTLLLPATPSLGRKLPASARIPTNPYTAHRTGTAAWTACRPGEGRGEGPTKSDVNIRGTKCCADAVHLLWTLYLHGDPHRHGGHGVTRATTPTLEHPAAVCTH